MVAWFVSPRRCYRVVRDGEARQDFRGPWELEFCLSVLNPGRRSPFEIATASQDFAPLTQEQDRWKALDAILLGELLVLLHKLQRLGNGLRKVEF